MIGWLHYMMDTPMDHLRWWEFAICLGFVLLFYLTTGLLYLRFRRWQDRWRTRRLERKILEKGGTMR